MTIFFNTNVAIHQFKIRKNINITELVMQYGHIGHLYYVDYPINAGFCETNT